MDDQTSSAESIFNIGAVTRMTSISISTLHAWERRYGFPHPSGRTPGGHRLYSEKDVSLLRQVKGQIEQGMAARQAVTAVQKMDNAGRLPGAHILDVFRGIEPSTSSQARAGQLAEALLQHDLPYADRLMSEMLTFFPPEEIVLNVIGPVLAQLGDAWTEGRITISDEHLASNYLRQRLLTWMVSGPPARAVSPIVLACTPDEWHEGSLLMLGVLLRRRGWPVTYLGQNVPFADLGVFTVQIKPGAIVLLAMRTEQAQALSDWPAWIKQIAGRPLVTYAGRVFVLKPELKDRVPGIYLGDRIQDGLARLEELLR
jgi:MerR family transcriptional regulator, light-induced transcriptional regulator